MRVTNAHYIQPNIAEVQPDPLATHNPESRATALDTEAPYKHALPEDSDPWTTILAVELEADTRRCNAWKDEVQNLLIFAGLFSAIVTAFLIESYKFLQPDPNAAIVGLLFHIASSLNNTSPFPPSVSPESISTPFSQTPSALRINVFWFISLIFSLTTVLVGTIALQWLREHQSYGEHSSKEKLAMLHMRRKALEAWYLPQVFAALPLTLQTALVLFLAGLIDFSLLLGQMVTMPAVMFIGQTIFFLAVTTVLPTLQGLSFLCGLYPRKTVPTPCPYKSPQSLAFRGLFRVVLHTIIFRLFPPPSSTYDLSPDSDTWKWTIKNPSLLIPDHLAPFIRKLWHREAWSALDRKWLSLRDACQQRIFDHDPDLYQHRTYWEDTFPLRDVTLCLVEIVNQAPGSKHTEPFLTALVHCFQEISESIWTEHRQISHFRQEDRRNRYFQQLHWKPCSLSNFLLHGVDYKVDQSSDRQHSYNLADYVEPKIKQRLFSYDQTLTFLRILLKNHTSPALAKYQLELWSQVLHFAGNMVVFTPVVTNNSSISIPDIIRVDTIESMVEVFLDSDQRYSAVANILDALLKSAASHRISEDQSMGSLCAHPQIDEVLDSLASWTNAYLKWARKNATKNHQIQGIDSQFVAIFKFISANLDETRTNWSSSSQERTLDVFFYLSGMFLWPLLNQRAADATKDQDSNFGKALSSSIDALHNIWTYGQKNERFEERIRNSREFIGDKFSAEWWSGIFRHRTSLQVVRQDESIAEGGLSGHCPDASLQLVISSDAVTTPLSITSPDIINRSSIQRLQDSDIDVQPISGREFVSNLGDTDASMPHSPSDFPAVLPTTIERPNIINNFPLSRSPSDEPGEMRPLFDDHIIAEKVPHDISLSLPPSTPKGPSRTVSQQVTLDGINKHDLQSGDLHLAIDVETPTVLKRVETEIPGSNGDRPQDEMLPHDE